MRVLLPSLVAIGLACGGASDPSGCRANAECGAGLVCIVPASGQPGSCQKPPIAIAMTAPVAGDRAGPAGLAVTARVTLAASDAAPPAVALVVDGAEAGALAQTARDGAVVSYAGTYLPPAGVVSTPTLFVVARTSAGVIPSDGVFVEVDTKPPVLKRTIGPACGTLAACPRDGAIDLFVAVAEDHPGVVEATVDLDGHQLAIPFGPSAIGTDLMVAIPLAKYPFPRFSGTVKARVRARDAFGNEATLDDLPEFPVTRLRWAYDAGAPVTGAAIAPTGDTIVGVSATTGNLRAIQSDGVPLWSETIAAAGRTTGSFVTAAPSLGANTVWVGSDDGKLYGYSASEGVPFGCPSTAAVGSMFTPAVRLAATDSAYAGGSAGKLYAAQSDGKCVAAIAPTSALGASALIASDKLYVITADATVKRFSTDLADDGWSVAAPSCADVAAPMAYAAGAVYFACGIAGQRSEIHQVDLTSSTAALLGTLSARPSGSAVFLDHDLVLGTNDGKLHRLTPPATGSGAWIDTWSALPALSSSVRGVLVAEQDRDGVVAYAVTGDGQLYALDGGGHAKWSTTGEASAPLGISPLTFPTIAPAASASQLPTLYAGSDDGHLYAVVVDSALDPRSPWPKSHHDVRNTGNADAPVYP